MNDPRPPKRLPTVIFIVGAAFVALAFTSWVRPYPNLSDPALLVSDASVTVENSKSGIAFIPARIAGAGLVFYPGDRVPAEAYAYLGRSLALRGHLCVLARFPLDFAILGSDRARAIIEAWPGIDAWMLGGHSLGGEAAAYWLRSNPGSVKGLVLLGSRVSASRSLASTRLAVLSISASKDGIVTSAKVDIARKYLPPGSRFVVLEGGNGANFGDFGKENGDGIATIDGSRQRQAVVSELLTFLETGR